MSALFPDLRLKPFAPLNEDEQQSVRGITGPRVAVAAGRTWRVQGQTDPTLYVLHQGWAASTLRLADGSCQIVKLHLPGDILGAPSLPYDAAIESLVALTSVEVSPISLAELGALFAAHPRIGALLFVAAQQELAFVMERVASLGRTEAPSRVAALLLHLHDRLSVQLGLTSPRIDLPLSQQQLGDVLGLSEVHVNRTLQQMERDRLIRRDKRQFEILAPEALRTLSGLPPRIVRGEQGWLPAAHGRADERLARVEPSKSGRSRRAAG